MMHHARFGSAFALASLAGSANIHEWLHCAQPWNSGDCLTADRLAAEALVEARKHYPNTAAHPNRLHNGVGDAFRHCAWSAWLTIVLGDATARGFTTRHEIGSPHDEQMMDLFNNNKGHIIGVRIHDYVAESRNFCTDNVDILKDEASYRCRELVREGGLRTL